MQNAISHRHAKAAVELAAIDRPKRAHINLVLRNTGCPLPLYTLARTLRTAQRVDEINAAHPAIVAKAA